MRTYSELSKLKTFKQRYDYLRLRGNVGESTFGFDRYLNQELYHSSEWQKARRLVIIRDEGCDLGIPGYEINDMIVIHHMNPINSKDIETGNPLIFKLEYLICTSYNTHQAIHFSNESLLPKPLTTRHPNDTIPWRL